MYLSNFRILNLPNQSREKYPTNPEVKLKIKSRKGEKEKLDIDINRRMRCSL